MRIYQFLHKMAAGILVGTESVMSLGTSAIIILNLSIHEHGMPFIFKKFNYFQHLVIVSGQALLLNILFF